MGTLSNWRVPATPIWFLAAAALVTGCSTDLRHTEAEARFASDIARWMKDYAATSSAPVTNLTQLFPFVKHGYPFFHHHELSRFGDRAAFSKSLAEKYIFFERPFTNRWAEGQVICMSVKPFHWGNEGCSRIYIAQVGPNYLYRDLPEEKVHAMLQEVQAKTVPLVVAAPPPRPPEVEQWSRPSLGDRYERLVWGISGALGQDSSMPVRTAISVLAAAALLVLVCAFVLLMRRKLR